MRPPENDPERTGDALFDFGAQAERTALAWQRTGLAAIGSGAVLLHAEAQGQFPPWPGMLLLAFGVIAAAVLAPARYLSILRAVRSTRTPLATLAIAGAATLTLGAAVGAAAALLPR